MARRIVILGRAGSGKTTLARQLGERMRAPVICLDAIWAALNPKEDIPTFRALMQTLHTGETWISDGNFAAVTFDIRLPGADLIVWLDPPMLACAGRAVARVFRRGETHKISKLAEVLAFIWNFDRVNRPRIEAGRIAHGPDIPVLRLASESEISAFVEASA